MSRLTRPARSRPNRSVRMADTPPIAGCSKSPGVRSTRSLLLDALLLDENSRSNTYPSIEIDEERANIGHEATASRLSDEQVFYLQSRGLTETAAKALIINGFFEQFTKELPMEYAVELNRLVTLQMEGSIG